MWVNNNRSARSYTPTNSCHSLADNRYHELGLIELSLESSTQPQTKPRAHWVGLLCIGAFLLLDATYFQLYRHVAGHWSESIRRSLALAVFGYGPQWAVILGVTILLFGPRQIPWALGLSRSLPQGLGVALLCTAILPLGFSVLASFTPPHPLVPTILEYALLPGFSEEILFRGFLFGLLFRFASWGFLPAALLGAFFFGASHLYQGKELADTAGIFAITAFGGLWFAWLDVEWDYNLWISIGFHVLMNLYWSLFSISDTALGSITANVLRAAVIVLSLILTLRHARRRGGRIIRGRAWWWGGPATTSQS